jgi:hypothetical protein
MAMLLVMVYELQRRKIDEEGSAVTAPLNANIIQEVY